MLIPREGLTQLLDKVLPFHSEIVKAVNDLVKLAASQNKCTLKEAEDECGEDDQEEDRPKKKARITWIIILFVTMISISQCLNTFYLVARCLL
jgi:hypothetical protein